MKKIITMYELLGLIKDDEAPKKIKIYDDIFELYGNHYYLANKVYDVSNDLYHKLAGGYAMLNDTIEILSEENKMKEMVYQKDRKTEVLYSGTYKGYDFYIMNLGTHPTAYVDVSNNQLLNGKYYGKIDIDVHGGLTYSADHLVIDTGLIIGWFIGWDYAHFSDYSGLFPEELQTQKKWTTKEIFEDVKSVIEQCINYKEDNNDEWEDIEELQEEDNFKFYNKPTGMSEEVAKILDFYLETLIIKINQLIKNQKHLKERLEEIK